jgi:hypothetical protein
LVTKRLRGGRLTDPLKKTIWAEVKLGAIPEAMGHPQSTQSSSDASKSTPTSTSMVTEMHTANFTFGSSGASSGFNNPNTKEGMLKEEIDSELYAEMARGVGERLAKDKNAIRDLVLEK